MCDECEALKQHLAKAHDDMMAQNETINATSKELTRLRRELTYLNEETPIATITRHVLAFYTETHPNANTSPDGERASMVRAAIRLGHTRPPLPCPVCDAPRGKKPKDQMCTVGDELIEALWFVRLFPFVGPNGRVAEAGKKCIRYDDIKYGIGAKTTRGWKASEETIETNRAKVRAIRGAEPERLEIAWRLTGRIHEDYAALFLDALGRQNGNGGSGLDHEGEERTMNGSEVLGRPEPSDAEVPGQGSGAGDQAGRDRGVGPSEDDGGAAAAQTRLLD